MNNGALFGTHSQSVNRSRNTLSKPQTGLDPKSLADYNASVMQDVECMCLIQKQEVKGLETIYHKHARVVKASALRVIHDESDADDLVQEIFLEVWNRAAKFCPDKGKPVTWMLTLARRRAIDRLRQRVAEKRAEERFLSEYLQKNPEPPYLTRDQQELKEFLGKAIAALPAAQRQVIDLTYQKGLSQRDIAAATGIPLGTVKTRLELAHKKIGKVLEEVGLTRPASKV